MKILLLSNKVPYPANDGSSIAIASMVDSLLKNDVDVTLLSLNTSKHFKTEEQIQKGLPAKLKFHQVAASTDINATGALFNLISGKAYHVSRFRQKAFSRKLNELLDADDFDIVQIEGLSMMVYYHQIKSQCSAKVSLRAHNVESQIWDRHIANEPNFLKRQYLKIQVDRLRAFEQKATYDVDAVVSITDEDLLSFRGMVRSKKAITIPFGIDLRNYQICKAASASVDLAYLASFDWLPNQQGAWWFIEEVWPLIHEQRPETTFRLGGRHMPLNMKALEVPGIEILPDVPSMRDFICDSRLIVVPLLAGSGMRIKILENMALGKCQVTTGIGAEGIKAKHGSEIILVDDPQAMADEIISLLNDPARLEIIGTAARKAVEQNYNNRKLGQQLLDFYESEVC